MRAIDGENLELLACDAPYPTCRVCRLAVRWRHIRIPKRSETRLSFRELADASDLRITIEPDNGNGLQATSQVMADKPVTVRRDRIGKRIGRLGIEDLVRLNAALAFVMGLAD